MIPKSGRDSVGGGGSTIIVPCSLKADTIQWGEGGSNRNFPLSSVAKSHLIFTPHRVIFVGRDTHFWLDTAKIRISCRTKKITQIAQIP